MSTSDDPKGRRFRYWPRTFWMQLLLVVAILIVLANVLLLTATIDSNGSLGIVDSGGTGP